MKHPYRTFAALAACASFLAAGPAAATDAAGNSLDSLTVYPVLNETTDSAGNQLEIVQVGGFGLGSADAAGNVLTNAVFLPAGGTPGGGGDPIVTPANEGDDLCLTVPDPGSATDGDFTWTFTPTSTGVPEVIPDQFGSELCLDSVSEEDDGTYTVTFDDDNNGGTPDEEVVFIVQVDTPGLPATGGFGLALLTGALALTAARARNPKTNAR